MFGKFIKQSRVKKSLTLDDVQEFTGLSKGYLSKLENGNRNKPKPETIRKLSEILDVPYITLLMKAGYITQGDIKSFTENNKEVTT